jgi:uncharacterized membrane protein (DUF373 family)
MPSGRFWSMPSTCWRCSPSAPPPCGRPAPPSSAWWRKIGIYFKTTRLPVRYLIYIAITALGRVLIEIVSAEHRTGLDILIVAGAILLLSFAVLVLRYGSHRYPSDTPRADVEPVKAEA